MGAATSFFWDFSAVLFFWEAPEKPINYPKWVVVVVHLGLEAVVLQESQNYDN